MRYKSILCVAVMALYVALASSFVSLAPWAQEKQKREEFGSSLKRLLAEWERKVDQRLPSSQ